MLEYKLQAELQKNLNNPNLQTWHFRYSYDKEEILESLDPENEFYLYLPHEFPLHFAVKKKADKRPENEKGYK